MSFVFRDLDLYRNYLPDDADEDHQVLGVSGGRSSAYQVAHIVEANGSVPRGAICTFENTGKEREETLVFVDRMDRHFQLDLLWLEHDPEAPGRVKRVTFETAARNGEPFDAFLSDIVPKRRDGTAGVRPLPNPAQRSCTATLKTKTLHRYVRQHLGWSMRYYSVLGFRADERARYERRVKADLKRGWDEGGKAVFPMYRAGAVQADVQAFFPWDPEKAACELEVPFTLELDSNWGNCDFCFMKSTWKIKEQMVYEALRYQVRIELGATPPPTVQWWIAKEERVSDRPGPFRLDRPTFRELWAQVCAGDLESAVPEGKEDACGTCSD